MKFSDPQPTTCPSCKSVDSLTRLVSVNTGFVLMGNGWDRPGMRAGSSQL
jgi:predicted nucleic acid-binding Zn ribbon protein